MDQAGASCSGNRTSCPYKRKGLQLQCPREATAPLARLRSRWARTGNTETGKRTGVKQLRDGMVFQANGQTGRNLAFSTSGRQCSREKPREAVSCEADKDGGTDGSGPSF